MTLLEQLTDLHVVALIHSAGSAGISEDEIAKSLQLTSAPLKSLARLRNRQMIARMDESREGSPVYIGRVTTKRGAAAGEDNEPETPA